MKDWKRLGNEKIQEYFLEDLKNGSVAFSKMAEEKIRDIKNENPKWDDFDTVIDRLNAPQLIDYYQRHVIAYRYRPGHGDDLYEAKNVFADKSGHCAQITAFTVYSLRRSGYTAKMCTIDEPRLRSPKGNNHRVALFDANGKKYVMDNGRTNPKFGIVRKQDYSPMIHPYNLNYTAVWEELLSSPIQ